MKPEICNSEGGDVKIDAFTAEVIRSTVVSITDEMKTNLMRTAYNMIIYEAEDFTVGLFDTDGNTISIGLGLPMFIRGLSDAVKAKLRHWGKENIEPGDILLTNDPQVMGSHLNHMIFTLPIFHDGELIAFSSSMGHWQDVGGVLGAITRDVFSEGLQMPFVKIFKRGQQDAELTAIIRNNCRLPELAMGDFRAQIAAIRTGERRLTQLLNRYGAETFKESVRLIFDQSERLARAAVRRIPDGIYQAESFMDDDGVNLGKHIPIKVCVEVSGDEMTVDLSEVSPQVAGPYNSGTTAGRSASEVAFKFLTTPLLLPINEGSFRPLKIILPPGRVVSATKPAPVRTWMTVPMTVADTIFKALASACPENVMAGQHADLAAPRTFGLDPKTGRAFHFPSTLSGGGWGALSDRDGQNATFCINDGDTHNTPVEAGEGKGPLFIVYRKLRQDSGGPGKFRGGLGVAQEVRLLSPGSVQSAMERTICAPWGLHGGKDALANRFSVVRKDGSVQKLPTGKTPGHMALEEGDGFLVEVGGGGGFWDPCERDLERVLADVRSGYVSLEAARRDYGVVIQQHGRRFELDVEATKTLRLKTTAANVDDWP
ncbi:MAG TPA: hydantoinase B/oxoprolinase family protein [Candidatus Acidoferrales bacterium]|nr:hydantoinase B/oxoprolinase family protein [Candidatus Acidoferrales bacterium]